MSGVGGTNNISQEYYNWFASIYGTEAAEKAKEAGLFDKLAKNEITWEDVTQWAEEQGYTPQIPPPGDGDFSGAKDLFDSYYDIAVLFHEMTIQFRKLMREDSYDLQMKIVQTLKDAADKKIEAANTLKEYAKNALIFNLIAAGIGILGSMGTMGAMSRVGFQSMAAFSLGQGMFMGVQGGMMGFQALGQYFSTIGQAEFQKIMAESDKIEAAAEGMKGEKERTDQYISELSDTLRDIRQKLAEFEAAQAKQWEAAASI